MNMVVFVLGIKFLATCYVATHKLLVQILHHCGLLLMYFVYNQFSFEASCGVCDIPKTFSGFYSVNKSPC